MTTDQGIIGFWGVSNFGGLAVLALDMVENTAVVQWFDNEPVTVDIVACVDSEYDCEGGCVGGNCPDDCEMVQGVEYAGSFWSFSDCERR